MKKPAPFFPESLSTLRPMMGFGFRFDLRQQLNDLCYESENGSNALAANEPPKYIDSITLKEFDTDSHEYLKHFTDTLDKALSGEPNTDKEQFEVTRMMDNPYSTLIFFDDQEEERKVSLSLLHHAAMNDNCDAMNELSSFYAPKNNHHKYKIGAYSSTKTALRLLIKSSNLGSSEATNQLASIYDNESHIKEVEPNKEMAEALRELAAKQYTAELSNKAKLNKTKDEEKQASTLIKAKLWYQATLDSGTGKPLKHEPLHAINKFYEKAQSSKAAGINIDQEMATKYLKSQTKNRLPYRENGMEIAKSMFDLGVMYKKGINGLERDDREASSLFFTASGYDQQISLEIKNLALDDMPSSQTAEALASAKTLQAPRFG